MTNNERTFAELNINLLYKYFSDKNVKDEDEKAELMEHYCRVISKYDASKGKLATILYKSLDKRRIQIYNYNHRNIRCPKQSDISLENSTDSDYDYIYNFMKINTIDFDEIYINDIYERVKNTLLLNENKNTTKKISTSKLFELLYNGYTRRDICKMYHLSDQAISERIKRIKVFWDKELEGC